MVGDRAGSQPDMALAKAILIPSVSTMIADAVIHPRETAQLSNICGFSPIFAEIGPNVVSALSSEIMEDIKRDGHVPVIESAAGVLSPALRETAFCFAVRIALADGILDDREKAALAAISKALAIPDSVATKIFDVIAMMQRPIGA